MMYRSSPLFAALFLLALLAPLFSGCGEKPTDEDRVRAAVREMAVAAEAKDIGALKKHISKRYSDPGGRDYDGIKAMAAFYFLQPEGISVFLRRTDVEVRGDRAFVTQRAVVTRGPRGEGGLLPSSSGGFVFDLTFSREGGDWLLVSAIWRQVGTAEAL